nr:GGDEF domain-containing phosphodiesterase [Lachnospiraceae bacterium]
MSGKSEKRYRKIKRTHIWSSIFEFCIFTVVSALMLIFAIENLAAYVVDTKIAGEYDRIDTLARLYAHSQTHDSSEIYSLMNEEGVDYLITDDDNNILYQNGENTCTFDGGPVTLTAYDEKVTVYRDSEKDYVYPGKNGRLMLDIRRFREWMSEDSEEEEKVFDLEAPQDAKLISLPIWLSVDTADPHTHIVAKALFKANRSDIRMFTTLIISIVALIGVILITMLGAAIKNVIRQRRMVSVFFTDVVTDGHNWTWFLVRGERALRKWSSSKNRYAVISLMFVNYRNYCVCHSIAEGEKLLCRFYTLINRSLNKKEICAHTTSSNFALLLRYNSEEELRNRLKSLTDNLASADRDHRFAFQIGVSLIEKAVDQYGKPVKRKDLDLDNEYNNASAARETLSATEDSGIAFFDDRLKDEQKWLDDVQARQQRALENEEFMVYYQPKYEPKTGMIRGAEALIRWRSPEFGIVPPGRFIPIFEKNGFITNIDHYMLRHVAADQRAWLDKGYSIV